MRSTRRLLAASRDIWREAVRHPFLRQLEDENHEDSFRRWLAYEARSLSEALSSLGCLLREAPGSHRYVLAQAVMMMAEELDWVEAHAIASPEAEELGYWVGRLNRALSRGFDRSILLLWLGVKLNFEALWPLSPATELYADYRERRTSAVVEAFLHDFEELAEVAVEALGMAEASAILLEVVEGQLALWDVGLKLVEGKE